MEKIINYQNEKPLVLHMLSGGRDSFLSACLLIEEGFSVRMVTFDNGHIDHVDRVAEVARWISERYPNTAVSYLHPMKTAMTLHEYMCPEWYRKSAERKEKYPELQTYQAHCLACKSAMYVHALSYCRAHGIRYLSEGAREQQGFFVELPEMRDRYEALCKNNGVELKLPVYDLKSDLERKRALSDRGLSTKTMEPQCYLGCPLTNPLTAEERRDLAKYYDEELFPLLQRDIECLIASKESLQLQLGQFASKKSEGLEVQMDHCNCLSCEQESF